MITTKLIDWDTMKRLQTLAAAALSLTMLTACGSDLDQYCTAVEDVMSSSETESPVSLSHGEAREMIEKAAAESPEELAEDWKMLTDATTAITDAMEASGLTEEQMDQLMSGQMPSDLTEEEMEAAATTMSEALSGFDIQEVNEASLNISDHAEEKCDVEMPTD